MLTNQMCVVKSIVSSGKVMLELWELGGRDGLRFSTYSWRTRMALHHKGLDFKSHSVAVSDKQAIAFSGQGKVPIIRVGDRVVPIGLSLGRGRPTRR